MSLAFRWLSRLTARAGPTLGPVDGARLGRLGDNAWVADREMQYARRHTVPLRMVVLRDAPGLLTLYAPVALDEGTREALAGLGRVHRVIVPNRFHTHFVGPLMADYPDASLLVPQWWGDVPAALAGRMQVVGSVETLATGLELRPVCLRPGLDELVLYHDPSETLVVCDLLYNFQQAGGGLTRWFYQLNGVWRRPAVSRLQRRLLLKDRQSLGEFYRWAMSKPFSQISMAHGQLVRTEAREHFYQLFRDYGH